MRYLNRRIVYLLSVALALFFVVYTLPTVGKMRSRLSSEYFKHKEFLFNLKNAPRELKRSADETGVGELLENLGVRAETVYRTESGLEVKLKELSWRKVPDLILRLEERYHIVSFSAVDNTGKGSFEVRIVLR